MALITKKETVNNFSVQLTNSPGTAGLTFSLDSITGLSSGMAAGTTDWYVTVIPASSYKSASEAQEIVLVTAMSGNDATVTRAQFGTTALNLISGDRVEVRPISFHANEWQDVLIDGNDDINVAVADMTALDIAGTTQVTGILDEDDFASDSATDLATQQSIGAFVVDLISSIATALFSGRVDEAAGISKGEVVFTSGATGNQMTVSLADNSNFAEVNAIAVAFTSASNNATIQLIASGLLTDLDTTSLAEGATLYLGAAGAIVDVHPSGIDAVILIGTCVRSHASLGQIFIKIQASTDVHDFDGVARNQIVNINTGTSAVASHSFINDADHRASISITSVANTQGSEHFSLFSDGYGNFNFLQNGNHPYEWFTDPTDSHNPANLLVKMSLSALGVLTTVGTMSAPSVHAGAVGSETVDAGADNLMVGTTAGDNGLTIFSGSGDKGRIDFADGVINRGGIEYIHAIDAMAIEVAGGSVLLITSADSAFSNIISTGDTTDTTSGTTGSIHTAGGLGVAKKLFVGDDATFAGDVTLAVGKHLFLSGATAEEEISSSVEGILDISSRVQTNFYLDTDGNAGSTDKLIRIFEGDVQGGSPSEVMNVLANGTIVTVGGISSDGVINHGAMVELTVSSGAITRTHRNHKILGEGAIDDTLHTISGGVDGDVIRLRASSDSQTITVSEVSNIKLGATTRVLNSEYDVLVLEFDTSTALNRWVETSFVDIDA